MQQGHMAPHRELDDEIDLFELAQELWREKILIVVLTLTTTLAALVYTQIVPSVYTYSVEAVVRPAQLHSYGPLALALATEGQQGVAVANELVGSNFLLLKKNLESKSNQAEFAKQYAELQPLNVSLSVPRGQSGLFVMSGQSNRGEQLAESLTGYLGFVAEQTVIELNSFLQGLGVAQQVSADMLYSLDRAPSKPSVTVKPKKKLIVAVGFVLGGMLGVFVALLRSAIRKRKAAQA